MKIFLKILQLCSEGLLRHQVHCIPDWLYRWRLRAVRINEDAPKLWNMLLEAGEAEGLIPCGLGARDTFRLEAAMPLYGHEMDAAIHPLETGLKFAVKMQKDDFIGKKALEEKSVLTRKRVGLRMIGRALPGE